MNGRNKALIITGIALFLVAAVIFLVAGAIAGWDFIGFFRSQTFIWLCVAFALYAMVVVCVVVTDKIKKL